VCVCMRACVVSSSCVPRSRLSLDFTFCNPLANELWSPGTDGTVISCYISVQNGLLSGLFILVIFIHFIYCN